MSSRVMIHGAHYNHCERGTADLWRWLEEIEGEWNR